MKISRLPEEERPRERCLRLGPSALSAVELLAIVLGGGSTRGGGLDLAHELLEHYRCLRNVSHAQPVEFATLPGIGVARSTQVAAAFELGRRVAAAGAEPMHIVSAPEDVARTMRPLLDGLGQEGVAVLHLGARNQALRLQLVALGTLNAAAVEPREVFRAAVGVGAASVVVAHNHPSGSAEPSDDDVRITRRLKACGQTLGIELLDHIVLGETDWVSLRERGLL